jgi:hypothetical protein
MTLATLGTVLVLLVVFGVVLYLVNLIPMHETVKKIINVVAILAIVLYVISLITGYRLPGLR